MEEEDSERRRSRQFPLWGDYYYDQLVLFFKDAELYKDPLSIADGYIPEAAWVICGPLS